MMGGDGHIEPDDPKLLAAATAFGEYVETANPEAFVEAQPFMRTGERPGVEAAKGR